MFVGQFSECPREKRHEAENPRSKLAQIALKKQQLYKLLFKIMNFKEFTCDSEGEFKLF